jgi:hypothetical protein
MSEQGGGEQGGVKHEGLQPPEKKWVLRGLVC